jgi:transcriptional regulator
LTFDNKPLTLLSNAKASSFHVILSEAKDLLATRVDAYMDSKAELLQGTLDLLILKTLALGPLHGWGISKRIRQLSSEVLQIGQGSLYPALYRLEDRGWIDAEWGISPEGRKAKFYRLTADGRRQLGTETESWRLFSLAVNHVLRAT